MTGVEATLWRRVQRGDQQECWLWRGSVSTQGYGQIPGVGLDGVRHRFAAHRMAYFFENGPIPEGLFVCHRCDTPRCCNPAHLFLGTAADNARDRNKKRRQARQFGETNGRYRYTDEMVEEFRRLHANGMSTRRIAALHGASFTHVKRLVHGRRVDRYRNASDAAAA